jgi:hypothetical protein
MRPRGVCRCGVGPAHSPAPSSPSRRGTPLTRLGRTPGSIVTDRLLDANEVAARLNVRCPGCQSRRDPGRCRTSSSVGTAATGGGRGGMARGVFAAWAAGGAAEDRRVKSHVSPARACRPQRLPPAAAVDVRRLRADVEPDTDSPEIASSADAWPLWPVKVLPDWHDLSGPDPLGGR